MSMLAAALCAALTAGLADAPARNQQHGADTPRVAAAAAATAAPTAVQRQERSRVAPANAPARITLTDASEPGAPLRITGTVVDTAGAPLRSASLYVYQTDARGYYTPADARADRSARIHGWLRTDAQGRFEIITVRPGSYPDTRNPQHVHFIVNAPGFRERVFEIVFDDDPLVDEQIRSRARLPNSIFSICRPTTQRGVQQCSERITLTRE